MWRRPGRGPKFQLFNVALLWAAVLFAQASLAQDYTRWSLPEGALARLGKGPIGGADRAVAYSPDGTRLAVAAVSGIWFYDAHTGSEVALLTGHTSPMSSVSFSADGTTLASDSDDNTVRLWDVETPLPVPRLTSGGRKNTPENPGHSQEYLLLSQIGDEGRS